MSEPVDIVAYTGKWTCSECDHTSDNEHDPCSCDDTCTEHVETIASLRSQLESARRERDEKRELLIIEQGNASKARNERDDARRDNRPHQKRYRCLGCGMPVQRYEDMEEFQHSNCDGLVVDVEAAIRLMSMREAERDAALARATAAEQERDALAVVVQAAEEWRDAGDGGDDEIPAANRLGDLVDWWRTTKGDASK